MHILVRVGTMYITVVPRKNWVKEEKKSHKTSIFKLVWCLVTYFVLISNLHVTIYNVCYFIRHLWHSSHYFTLSVHRADPKQYVHLVPETRENNQILSKITNFSDFYEILSVISNKKSIFLEISIFKDQFSLYHDISQHFLNFFQIL